VNSLDREEQEILATFEAGEWQSVGEADRLLKLQSYAKAAIAIGSKREDETLDKREPNYLDRKFPL
jgi:hypothetical protein